MNVLILGARRNTQLRGEQDEISDKRDFGENGGVSL